MRLSKKLKFSLIASFAAVQCVFFVLMLVLKGPAVSAIQFSAIALAFCFSLIFISFKNKTFIIQIGLAFTVCADVCLVLARPADRLLGMIFFSIVQIAYFVKLLFDSKNKAKFISNIIVRAVLILGLELAAYFVVGASMDALVGISMFYYANLLSNIIFACLDFKKNPYFAIGMILFALCDTLIGLNVAASSYLSIAEGSFLHWLAFPLIDLAWVFYLPSQALISISCTKSTSN